MPWCFVCDPMQSIFAWSSCDWIQVRNMFCTFWNISEKLWVFDLFLHFFLGFEPSVYGEEYTSWPTINFLFRNEGDS